MRPDYETGSETQFMQKTSDCKSVSQISYNPGFPYTECDLRKQNITAPPQQEISTS